MFAELVCLEMTPAKSHGGASIFRGLVQRWANQITFNLVRQLPPLTRAVQMHRPHGVDYSRCDGDPSSPPKLVTLRRTAQRSGAFVLVAKDQSPFFQIVGGYFYRHTIPSQGFDPIPFHSSSGVGDELMSVVEPNAVTGVGQYLGHETLEFQESVLRHVMFLLNYRHNFARVEHGRAPVGVCRV